MIKVILSVFIAFGLMFGLKASIHACTTTGVNFRAAALQASAVFIGKTTKVENVKVAMVVMKGDITSASPDLFTPPVQKLSLEVSEVIKGEIDNTIEVLFEPSSCFGKFTNQKSIELVVFAYKWSPLLSNDESLLSEENRLKQLKLKAEADRFNHSLPLLKIFAVPLRSIKEDELKAIKNIAKTSNK